MTPVLLRPEEDRRLIEFGLGLTSGCDRPTSSSTEISGAEQALGARALLGKVTVLRPDLVALPGLTLYPVVFPRGDEPGPGLKRSRLAGSRVFVLSNPSGRNRAYPGFEKKLVWFHELARMVGRGAHTRPRSIERATT